MSDSHDAINRELDRAKGDLGVEHRARGKSSAATDIFEDIPKRFGEHLSRLKHDILHLVEGHKMHLRLTRRIEDRVEAIEKTSLEDEAGWERLDRLEEAFLQDANLGSKDVASLRALIYQYKQEAADAIKLRDRYIGALMIGFGLAVLTELIRAWSLVQLAHL